MQSLARDFRHAVRNLLETPAFTLFTVVTLAIAIAANTAVFSLVYEVVLRPLALDSPDRVLSLWEIGPDDAGRLRKLRATAGDFLDWREQSSVFEDLAIFGAAGFNWTSDAAPEQLLGARVSPSYFSVLGVHPTLGRAFTPEETAPGAERVIILSYGLWQRRFGAAEDVVEKSLTLDGEPYRIVGVMPRGVYPTWPQTTGRIQFLPTHQEVWAPMTLTEERRTDRRSHVYGVLGRLRDGVSIEEARAEMDTIARRLEATYPDSNQGRRVLVQPFLEEVVGTVRPALFVLLGGVGVVLLIACANISSLELARSSARRRELAIRAAIGARRSDLTQQLLCESLALSGCGGLLGIGLAVLAIDALVLLSPERIPRLSEAGLNVPVVLFGVLTTLFAGVLFGTLPALRSSRPDLQRDLGSGTRSQSMKGPYAAGSFVRALGLDAQKLLVVAEVSMAVVLVMGAGLLVQSFLRLSRVDTGFRARDVVVAELALPPADYEDWSSISRFHDSITRRLGALHNVRVASVAYDHPLESNWIDSFRFVGSSDESESLGAALRIVGESYFETMGIDVVRGRAFTELDDPNHPGAVMVNEAFVRGYLPDVEPLGVTLLTSTPSNVWNGAMPETFEIVGVVRDVRFLGPASDTEPAFYLPARQFPLWTMLVVAGTDSDPSPLMDRLREEIWQLDPNLPVENMTTVAAHLDAALAAPRFNARLLGLFGLSALALAAMGIYGLLSFAVSQRTGEIGLRMALGARAQDVVRMIVGQGTRLTLIGVGIGVTVSLVVTRFLESLLFQVSALDVPTFGAVVVFLVSVALAAAYLPARRATRIAPVRALRYE
jgi:putative ABC transport system permease protein